MVRSTDLEMAIIFYFPSLTGTRLSNSIQDQNSNSISVDHFWQSKFEDFAFKMLEIGVDCRKRSKIRQHLDEPHRMRTLRRGRSKVSNRLNCFKFVENQFGHSSDTEFRFLANVRTLGQLIVWQSCSSENGRWHSFANLGETRVKMKVEREVNDVLKLFD